MKKYLNNKWVLSWLFLIIVFICYSIFLLKNHDKEWFNAFMQIGYIFISLVAMVLVMLHTFSEANKGAEKQIEVFKDESLKQIQAISNSTISQIESFKISTKEQIEVFQQSTEKQVTAIQRESERQITTIQESTKIQLSELQKVNSEQILAIQKASQEQTNAILASTEKQIAHFSEVTKEQIKSYQDESEKQINNLQNSTEKQVNSFVDQTNNIVGRLEKLSESITNLTELNKEMLENEKELRELEEEKFRIREEELRSNYIDKYESVERIRPDFHFRTEVDSYLLVFNFIYFYLYNTGGDASSIVVNVSLRKSYNNESTSVTSKTFYNVGRMKQLSFKWLRAKHFKDYDQVVVEVSSRDLQHREYHGHWSFARKDNVWIKIDTSERNVLGNGNNGKFINI